MISCNYDLLMVLLLIQINANNGTSGLDQTVCMLKELGDSSFIPTYPFVTRENQHF